MEIKIMADRMIDLPKEELDSLNISTMSCYVNMNGKSYEDLIDVYPDDIFTQLKKTGKIAQTAAKSPEEYYNFFEPFTGENKAVIHFAVSSGISSIYENAVLAASRLPNTYVIDTRTLCNGIALLAKYAIELIEGGETDAKKVYELCLEKRAKVQGSFLIATLECLRKGGRCSGMQYFASNLLKIKPVITLGKSDGRMQIRDKILGGQRHVLAKYIARTFKEYPNPDLKQLYIAHFCKDELLIQYVVDTVAQHHKFENIQINTGGCNCAIHSGTNTFGIFYFVQ